MATLYGNPISINGFGPQLLLEEAKIPYTFHNVDIMKGETRTPEFMTMNPMHAIPTFKDADGFCVWESNAIMRYVVNKHNLSQFYPSDPRHRARIDMALDWRQTTFYKKVAAICYPKLFGHGSAEEAQKAAQDIHEDFDIITDSFLKDTKFIGANHPTIADFAIAPCFKFLEVTTIPIPPAAASYYEHFKHAVPSFDAKIAPVLTGYIASKK